MQKKERYNDRPRDNVKHASDIVNGFFTYIQYRIETKFK